jgi:hypothetical protein
LTAPGTKTSSKEGVFSLGDESNFIFDRLRVRKKLFERRAFFSFSQRRHPDDSGRKVIYLQVVAYLAEKSQIKIQKSKIVNLIRAFVSKNSPLPTSNFLL